MVDWPVNSLSYCLRVVWERRGRGGGQLSIDGSSGGGSFFGHSRRQDPLWASWKQASFIPENV